MRTAVVQRNTKETQISGRLKIEGRGKYGVSTGIRFFDHMLELFTKHGGFVNHAGANLHARVLYGRSSHHKIEAIFKCFARALKYACSTDRRLRDQLPSTKGLL